jgi:Mobilization protein NikA
MNRDTAILVRLTKRERDVVKELAWQSRMTVGQYLRNLIQQAYKNGKGNNNGSIR